MNAPLNPNIHPPFGIRQTLFSVPLSALVFSFALLTATESKNGSSPGLSKYVYSMSPGLQPFIVVQFNQQ